MSNLKTALQGIKDAVVDLATLEVATYTGDLSATATDAAKWTSFTTAIKGDDLTVGGTFQLRLYTYISADGDARLYRSSDEPSAALVAAHESAVKAGIETRASIVALFKDVIGWGD